MRLDRSMSLEVWWRREMENESDGATWVLDVGRGFTVLRDVEGSEIHCSTTKNEVTPAAVSGAVRACRKTKQQRGDCRLACWAWTLRSAELCG